MTQFQRTARIVAACLFTLACGATWVAIIVASGVMA